MVLLEVYAKNLQDYIQTHAIYLPIGYPVAAMCSIVQDAIKKFEDNEEKEKLASDALNIMLELVEHQKNAFYLKVTYAEIDA